MRAGGGTTSASNASGAARGSRFPTSSPSAGGCGSRTDPASAFGPSPATMSGPTDFVADRTHDGRKVRMLNVGDEFTHECLAIRVDRKLKAIDVIEVLSDLFILRGAPG